jgi:hypothetical protein
MLSSMIGSVGSFFGMNEADRIEKTLGIIGTTPDGVPLSKLMGRERRVPGIWHRKLMAAITGGHVYRPPNKSISFKAAGRQGFVYDHLCYTSWSHCGRP